VPERADLLDGVLRGAEYTFETDRHAALVGVLGLPSTAVGSGYETISQGEPPEGVREGELRLVGAARVRAAPPPPPPDLSRADTGATLAKLRGLVRPSPELAAIIGPAPLPYGTVVMKVMGYVTRRGLGDERTSIVRADAALRAVYGVDRIPFKDLSVGLDRHLTPAGE
jgi:hypothetical protein